MLFKIYYIHILVIVLKFGKNIIKKCMESENEKLHHRLKKMIGQAQAVDRIIKEDLPCEDVLSQINAAKSALHKAGQATLESHIKYCISEGMKNGDVEEIMKSFILAIFFYQFLFGYLCLCLILCYTNIKSSSKKNKHSAKLFLCNFFSILFSD